MPSKKIDIESLMKEFKTTLLKTVGYSNDEIEKIDLTKEDEDAFQEMLRKKLMGAMINNGVNQRMVD